MKEISVSVTAPGSGGRVRDLAETAFFASFTAVCSQISIPLPFTPIPINCGLLSVFMAGCILGSKKGALSQIVYVLLGCVGLPVFANFHGGAGAIIGPTGGYIVGYIAAAFISGLPGKGSCHAVITGLSMAAGLFVCYALGTAWFVISAGVHITDALYMCVIPFLIGDAVKIVCAIVLSKRLKMLYAKTTGERKTA
ncbi:MAG: biotin transporter BioY [Clostridiales bacterium]|jgi:biotin transport system substrate-specific component|nr:biotin transporter BioY [Clostridiales bacterium]